MNKEQARSKVRRLEALAESTTFPDEAAGARALADELRAKHGFEQHSDSCGRNESRNGPEEIGGR
jgi:hypothetical protein